MRDPRKPDPLDECECGDYRRDHFWNGLCIVCGDDAPPPHGPNGCKAFRLGFRVGEREQIERRIAIGDAG
jgi:hypothetical protein